MLDKKCFCISLMYKNFYEVDDFDKIYEVLSTLKNKKSKINCILMEKFINMIENPDFEQDYWTRTAMGVYRMGHDNNRYL